MKSAFLTRLATALALALVLVLTLGASLPAGGKPRSWTKEQYGTPGQPGARAYWRYVPASLLSGKVPRRVPLLVYLHGCIQTADEAAKQTQFNQLADRKKFIVVYPQQNVTSGSSAPVADGNGEGCWNWFLPEHQARDAGEPASIAGITRAVMKRFPVDPRRVYVEGVSAGADMAVIMGATYPDLYAAVGAIAGCAYATCSDLSGRLTYEAMSRRARVVPMFVENGTSDNLNNIAMATSLVQSWLGVDDLVDDGEANLSISREPAATEHRGTDQTPAPGSGDACVFNHSWTCPGGVVGFQGTYPYTIQRYRDARGCSVLDFWMIHGLTHAYPGSPSSSEWGDPLGPNITRAAWAFFENHPRGTCAR